MGEMIGMGRMGDRDDGDDRAIDLLTWQVSRSAGEQLEPVPVEGRVKVLIAFDDHPGRTVYHCHILDHEDQGMMATVEAL